MTSVKALQEYLIHINEGIIFQNGLSIPAISGLQLCIQINSW
jgi:hypothetical protein